MHLGRSAAEGDESHAGDVVAHARTLLYDFKPRHEPLVAQFGQPDKEEGEPDDAPEGDAHLLDGRDGDAPGIRVYRRREGLDGSRHKR